jgi:hypothetical protein
MPLAALEDEGRDGLRIRACAAGETPSGGKPIVREDGSIGVRNWKGARKHAYAAAAALAHSAAGELEAERSQGGNERAAEGDVDLNAEGLEANAHASQR